MTAQSLQIRVTFTQKLRLTPGPIEHSNPSEVNTKKLTCINAAKLTLSPSSEPASWGTAERLLKVMRPIKWSPSLDGCHVTGCWGEMEQCLSVPLMTGVRSRMQRALELCIILDRLDRHLKCIQLAKHKKTFLMTIIDLFLKRKIVQLMDIYTSREKTIKATIKRIQYMYTV